MKLKPGDVCVVMDYTGDFYNLYPGDIILIEDGEGRFVFTYADLTGVYEGHCGDDSDFLLEVIGTVLPETVEGILTDWLTANGFNGLSNQSCPNEPCGCRIDDLAPCDCLNLKECKPWKFKTKRGAK